MARRPQEYGLKYYNIDTDRYSDFKIRKLKRNFKCVGISVYDYLLCKIYQNGCFIVWGESTTLDVAEYFDLKETTVNEVVNYCCSVGLFDTELRTNENILTSKSIQERYIFICKNAKIKYTIQNSYLIKTIEIDKTNETLDEFEKIETSEEINKTSVENAKSTEELPKSTEELQQSKSKSKIKVNKREIYSFVENDKSHHLKLEYENLLKTFTNISQKDVWVQLKNFIEIKKPTFFEPYLDLWNVFAISKKIILEPQKATTDRVRKFNIRIKESGFDFIKILESINKSNFAKGDNNRGWKATIEFILNSEENYTKLLEGKYV